jgi:hypothetical protein
VTKPEVSDPQLMGNAWPTARAKLPDVVARQGPATESVSAALSLGEVIRALLRVFADQRDANLAISSMKRPKSARVEKISALPFRVNRVNKPSDGSHVSADRRHNAHHRSATPDRKIS